MEEQEIERMKTLRDWLLKFPNHSNFSLMKLDSGDYYLSSNQDSSLVFFHESLPLSSPAKGCQEKEKKDG